MSPTAIAVGIILFIVIAVLLWRALKPYGKKYTPFTPEPGSTRADRWSETQQAQAFGRTQRSQERRKNDFQNHAPAVAAAADDDSGISDAVEGVMEGLMEAVPDVPRRRFQAVDPDAPTVVPAAHIDHSRMKVERDDPPASHAPSSWGKSHSHDHSHDSHSSSSYDSGSSSSDSGGCGGGDGGGGGGD